jgi:hypothetical protein
MMLLLIAQFFFGTFSVCFNVTDFICNRFTITVFFSFACLKCGDWLKTALPNSIVTRELEQRPYHLKDQMVWSNIISSEELNIL